MNSKKLYFLPTLDIGNDMDDKDFSKFFFKNKIISVTKDGLAEIPYSEYKGFIWEDRLLAHDIGEGYVSEGQFQNFCFKISGECAEKFNRFKSILGYLLHRNKNPALAKAVILYDEKMNESGQAEGGTGKTLISQALKHCREVVIFNGKEIKENSWFRNQRIEITTDLMAYDDVKQDFNFASLFPVITTAIEVEKKRQQAFEIPFEKSPKVLISSNHYVKGPGGSSDRRRRCEFELANYYSEKFTPEDDFGNLFFNQWKNEEWHQFYFFMMECVQVFLTKGLIDGDKEKEKRKRLLSLTCPEFLEVIEAFCEIGIRHDHREFVELLKIDLPDLSPHRYTKWLKIYADEMNLELTQGPSGGGYFFKLSEKK